MKFKLLPFLFPAIAISSCVDIPDFKDTPVISYNGLSQFTQIDTLDGGSTQRVEMVVLSIRFEDGDGDLGVNPRDLQGENPVSLRYAAVSDWGLPANYEVVTMTKLSNGTWSEVIFPNDSVNFFPELKTDSKPGPIKGTLDMYIRNPVLNSYVQAERRYKVRVIDRKFNISNQVTVPEGDFVKVPVPRE
ncbi:hypothetical protein [Dyadobacter sp. CY312]|uniref:hypothetical protein n=1 Tax=Dyadobacter sp. CY312 TaxID=2907303 RepID=UPI001F31CD21|nr:hypothetical protein [Dyadobacter sp. CY312]MCE7040912.1 hypothetical protein [Dyadobacter sp. CY312]